MSEPPRVLFATSHSQPTLTADDALAAGALRIAGCEVAPAIWSETDPASISPPTTVVIRSCWDYHLRPDHFAAWVRALDARGVRVLNPPPLLLWNMHKRYLVELAARGVPIVPSVLIRRGTAGSLRDVLRGEGWGEVVVKPAISASAHATWRAAALPSPTDEERFAALTAAGEVLVQPYLREIEDVGEWSLVFLGGTLSHAVRKRPRAGDFRVQEEHGGSAVSAVPPTALAAAAGRVVAALDEAPLYARVDGVESGGRFLLMELECLDPFLFFAVAPASARRFAALVRQAAGARPVGGGTSRAGGDAGAEGWVGRASSSR